METDETAPATCASCGATAPRGEMFGVEPDLRCEDCAAGVRKRMHVRYRPLAKEHLPRATAACLAVAVALFLADHMFWPPRADKPQPAWLAALNQDWDIWLGAVWKHLTSMFLHGGILHILFNGFVLYGVGRVVEQRWGTGVFLGLLVLTGMAGQAGEFIAHDARAVGLSGGILGLIGFLIAYRRHDALAGAVMHPGNVRFVLIYVVGCAVATLAGLINIANWAHGVGLGLGWLFGLASLHAQRRLLVPAVALLGAAIVVLSVFVAFGDGGSLITRADGTTRSEVLPRTELRRQWIQQNR